MHRALQRLAGLDGVDAHLGGVTGLRNAHHPTNFHLGRAAASNRFSARRNLGGAHGESNDQKQADGERKARNGHGKVTF